MRLQSPEIGFRIKFQQPSPGARGRRLVHPRMEDEDKRVRSSLAGGTSPMAGIGKLVPAAERLLLARSEPFATRRLLLNKLNEGPCGRLGRDDESGPIADAFHR